jgi:predicted alpha/beta hydrolase
MSEAPGASALSFRTDDGVELSALRYGQPATARGGVLIAPAMGVPQAFYAAFAQWLAGQGWLVMSFDYRGMGASRPAAHARSLRGFEASIRTWAERDAAGALEALAAQLPDAKAPLHWLGHSLGGQIVGLLPNHGRVHRIVTVGTGSGYWRENAPSLRRIAWLLWYGIAPAALRLAGYFPGRRLRMVGDLPEGVMRQWRAWCLHRDYLMGEGGPAWRQRYAGVRAPILALSFTDDEFMSARSIESLHGFYSGATQTHRRIAPHQFGQRRIGHFGFFRPQHREALWTQVAQWLHAQETTA